MTRQPISPADGISPLNRILTLLLLPFLLTLWSCGGGGNNGGGNNNTSPPPVPSLTLSAVTQGNFSSGEQGATYNINVTNKGNGATNGQITIVDPPTGFTVTNIAGAGWSCTLSTTTCTRSDALAPGQSYPPITVTGNVTAANGTPVTIALSASGGGLSAAATASPTITVAAPALSISETNAANFNLGQQGATYTVTVRNGASAGATSAAVTVAETVPSGETLVSMSGTGWTCPGSGGPNTCDRSDTLVTGASYPALTLTVNVAGNAASPEVSQVQVSGGGMASPASGSDSTTINMPDLAIAESHSGTPAAGGTGTFNITVGNDAAGTTAGPTGGPITVTDTLPAQFTFVSGSATGWSCGAAGQVVTCTNPGPISPGASAATIPLVVAVNSSAEGAISNSASVSTFGDSNAANNSSTDSVTFSPDVAINESHGGNFGAGEDGIFTLSVANVGNAATTGSITITDTLSSELTFASGNASGWTCGAASQLVTCTNPGPLAPGSATSIPLIVAVSSAASTGSITNTGAVSTPGDNNASNDVFADNNVPVLSTASLPELISIAIPGGSARGVIYAGGNLETINITVTNEGSGDVLTPTLTLNGANCTTCGTLGPVTAGTAGSYTMSYTPPTSLAAPVNVTLTVNSSLTNSFPATGVFTVFPAGTRVVKMTGLAGGPGTENLTAFVYNDSGTTTGATIELLGAGYACPAATGGGTLCGTLTVGTTTSGTTTGNGTTGIPFTSTPLTYTPPATVPDAPFQTPMILAVSNADATARAQRVFPLGPGFVATNGMIASRLNTALTNAGPIPLAAGIGGDTGVNQSLTWTLTVNGENCQPGCGTLGTPTGDWNGGGVDSYVTYTPPATVPASPANQPVLTVSSVDVIHGAQQTDSVQFQIKDGTCGGGNEGVLNGQYAFLLQGGGAGPGYVAFMGSFTADGSGHITGGLLDINRTAGPLTGLSILSAGSSYSIGSDNRGCLTLANSFGGPPAFRIAVGKLDGSNHATLGEIIRFDDNTGFGTRLQGSLMKQDPTAFANLSAGNYVFGYQGVQGAGARLATIGLYSVDGAGHLTNFDTDAFDGQGNSASNVTTASGTYSIDSSTGRGTGTITNSSISNSVFYVVNSSEFLSMTTDPLGNSPILSGLNQKQTTTTFTQTSLDNNAYIYSLSAFDPSNGENVAGVAQVQFTTNGVDSGEMDVNEGGTLSTQAITGAMTISANGRMVGQNVVSYGIGTDSAVILLTDTSVPFGYVYQQTGGPFSNASLSGPVFFGGGAPSAGSSVVVGTGTFDGVGTLTATIDVQHPDGQSPSQAIDEAYSVTPATGKVAFTSPSVGDLVGFVISNSKVLFIPTASAPQLILGQ